MVSWYLVLEKQLKYLGLKIVPSGKISGNPTDHDRNSVVGLMPVRIRGSSVPGSWFDGPFKYPGASMADLAAPSYLSLTYSPLPVAFHTAGHAEILGVVPPVKDATTQLDVGNFVPFASAVVPGPLRPLIDAASYYQERPYMHGLQVPDYSASFPSRTKPLLRCNQQQIGS